MLHPHELAVSRILALDDKVKRNSEIKWRFHDWCHRSSDIHSFNIALQIICKRLQAEESRAHDDHVATLPTVPHAAVSQTWDGSPSMFVIDNSFVGLLVNL